MNGRFYEHFGELLAVWREHLFEDKNNIQPESEKEKWKTRSGTFLALHEQSE